MEAHFSRMDIPSGHRLVQTGLEVKGARRGLDTDVYHYDELDAAGQKVGEWTVEDSTSVYPPFERYIDVSRSSRSG